MPGPVLSDVSQSGAGRAELCSMRLLCRRKRLLFAGAGPEEWSAGARASSHESKAKHVP